MAWYLRAVEVDGGGWACRFGRFEFDTHTEMDQAIDHLTELAADRRPVELFVHFRDGSVRNLGLA